MIDLESILMCEKNIIDNIEELKENIEVFNKNIEEIQVVIDALKCYYNTSGGDEKIQKIVEIEFDKNILGTLLNEIADIKCEHTTNNMIISRKFIE